jgi:peptidyl-prolyl cis-trans isomerase SurA
MKMKNALLYPSVAVAAFLSVAVARPTAEIIEQILVKVNGEIFTKTDLEARQVAALRQAGQQGDLKSNASDQQLRKMLDEVTPQLMVNVIDEMLIVQRGRELGYKMTDDQFQGTVDLIKKDNKINTDEEFQAALKQENMTMADLRHNVERQWIVSRVQQTEFLGKIAVSEAEARAYYDAHKNEFTSAVTVTLREILVAVPKDASVATDAAARQKAADIRRRAVAGESFQKLAAELSDSPSRANEGLVGPLSLSDVSPDFRKLLDQMKPGDITDPLRAPNGYQMLKLESVSAAETQPFEQAREEIGNRVFTDKRKVEYDKYLAKLRGEAIIEWKNDDIKKAYEQGLAQQKAGAAAAQ